MSPQHLPVPPSCTHGDRDRRPQPPPGDAVAAGAVLCPSPSLETFVPSPRKESGAVRTAPKHERDFGDNLKAAAEGVQRSATAPLQHRAQPERLLPACAAPKSCCLDSLGLGGFGGRAWRFPQELGISLGSVPRTQDTIAAERPGAARGCSTCWCLLSRHRRWDVPVPSQKSFPSPFLCVHLVVLLS